MQRQDRILSDTTYLHKGVDKPYYQNSLCNLFDIARMLTQKYLIEKIRIVPGNGCNNILQFPYEHPVTNIDYSMCYLQNMLLPAHH